jgi:peptidoglycan-associated lipoprotein
MILLLTLNLTDDFVKNILVEIQDFEIKRAELFRKYGEEVGEGDQKRLQVKPENEKKFNSRDDDFSPAFADKKFNSIYFTSSRDGATGSSIDDWTGQNFSDIFVVKKDRKGEWSSPSLIDKDNMVNTESNEGQPSFNTRFNTMYFTRCGQEKKMKLGCQIYRSTKKGRGWGKGELIKIGSDTAATFGHPSISGDELTIFFASDMEGGYGGKDIWYATRSKKSKPFKKVFNCGPDVNTIADEVFPFFRSDTLLYFASNGHVGMGGLDIYRAVKVNGKWSDVSNMKSPVNSNADDFGIIFYPGKEEGFLSSNRKGGKGGDDLWYFIRPPLEYTLQGVVKDDRTLQFIPDAVVKLVGSDGSSIEDKTDESGFYSFDKTQILVNTSYELFVSKDGYFSEDGRMTTVGLQVNKDFVMDFILKPIPKEPILLPEILYDLAAAFHHWKGNRNLLVSLMTPLYFARVASFVNRTRNMNNDQAEAVVERQAEIFEQYKDYLIRRWDENINYYET